MCLGLAMIGRFYLATQIEVNEFYSELILSFVWLGVGFVFYASKWPESRYSSSWVQLYFPSHFWWHCFVFLNGYTLFWIAFGFCLHVEKFWN